MHEQKQAKWAPQYVGEYFITLELQIQLEFQHFYDAKTTI